MGLPRFDWLTSGTAMTAERALTVGIANEVVADESVIERSMARAQAFTKMPVPALSLTKRLVRVSWQRGFTEQLEAEATLQEIASQTSTNLSKSD